MYGHQSEKYSELGRWLQIHLKSTFCNQQIWALKIKIKIN